tara:strand:+ start:4321 stop:4767 length:447 start_codon:yes stop_codon:yes gene_type:complete
MLKFLKKNVDDKIETDIDFVKVVSLLIHAAKIDENYTDKEKQIIINFVGIFLKENNKNVSDSEISILIEKAEKYEKDSNQILEFTKEIKKADLKSKKFIIKTLWQIILSDNKSGIYESNLMRRICGLLYLPDKFSGEIKSNILLEKKQ